MADEHMIEQKLWRTGDPLPPDAALLLQYQIYVASAEKISDRRGLSNTFFVTLNLAAVGFITKSELSDANMLQIIFPVAGLIVCAGWAALLLSYRKLNTAKFLVVGLLEKRLPASPFWGAEWSALGQGKEWRRHVPLGAIEMVAPFAFALLYGFTIVAFLSS